MVIECILCYTEEEEGLCLFCYEKFHWPVKILYSMSIL